MGTEIISVPEESFVEGVFLKIGKSQRAIRTYIQIASDIPEDIRTLIKGTTLKDRQANLLRLIIISDKDRQRDLVEKTSTVKSRPLQASSEKKNEK